MLQRSKETGLARRIGYDGSSRNGTIKQVFRSNMHIIILVCKVEYTIR
jgi:hypothetical protein